MASNEKTVARILIKSSTSVDSYGVEGGTVAITVSEQRPDNPRTLSAKTIIATSLLFPLHSFSFA